MKKVCICGNEEFEKIFALDKKPERETAYPKFQENYHREAHRCTHCGHFIAVHDFDMEGMYDGTYADTTYGDKLKANFEKVINLPPEKSDNVKRVDYVIDFAKRYFPNISGLSALDVGSGLCVFLNRLKNLTDWNCTALDPDYNQAKLAREVVGINAIQADFFKAEDIGKYNIISFNKVLEHIKDPVSMLKKSAKHLASGGLVYIELPDGTMAAMEDNGKNRQEFFVDHLHIFSFASIGILCRKAGFTPLEVTRVKEPSNKYTLRVFARVA